MKIIVKSFYVNSYDVYCISAIWQMLSSNVIYATSSFIYLSRSRNEEFVVSVVVRYFYTRILFEKQFFYLKIY